MAIDTHCPNGHLVTANESLAGKTGFCPRCHAKMRVPAAGGSDAGRLANESVQQRLAARSGCRGNRLESARCVRSGEEGKVVRRLRPHRLAVVHGLSPVRHAVGRLSPLECAERARGGRCRLRRSPVARRRRHRANHRGVKCPGGSHPSAAAGAGLHGRDGRVERDDRQADHAADEDEEDEGKSPAAAACSRSSASFGRCTSRSQLSDRRGGCPRLNPDPSRGTRAATSLDIELAIAHVSGLHRRFYCRGGAILAGAEIGVCSWQGIVPPRKRTSRRVISRPSAAIVNAGIAWIRMSPTIALQSRLAQRFSDRGRIHPRESAAPRPCGRRRGGSP